MAKSSRNIREKIKNIYGFCWICCKKFHPKTRKVSVDHLVPRSKNGGSKNNLVLACKKCNNARGNISVEETIELIERGERVGISGPNIFKTGRNCPRLM